MGMEDELTDHIGIIIIIVVLLILFFVVINSLTEGGLVRTIVCSVTFWIPFGASIAQQCRAIPV